MIDRERLLAADHQAGLYDEARRRRLAAQVATGHTDHSRLGIVRVRLALGHRLVPTGQRPDTGTDPCGPIEARPA